MAKRKSIHLEGFAHTNPIPTACKLGNIVMSGSIMPRNAEGNIPATLEEQCTLMFKYVAEVMAKAGGSMDDIIKFSVSMKDASNREVLNRQWKELFPDPESRPARHTEQKDLVKGLLIQCEIVGVIAD
jgi:2-iminobutanoate/2-iminopropanoate deaminase